MEGTCDKFLWYSLEFGSIAKHGNSLVFVQPFTYFGLYLLNLSIEETQAR